MVKKFNFEIKKILIVWHPWYETPGSVSVVFAENQPKNEIWNRLKQIFQVWISVLQTRRQILYSRYFEHFLTCDSHATNLPIFFVFGVRMSSIDSFIIRFRKSEQPCVMSFSHQFIIPRNIKKCYSYINYFGDRSNYFTPLWR